MGWFDKLERSGERVHFWAWLVGLFTPPGWATSLGGALLAAVFGALAQLSVLAMIVAVAAGLFVGLGVFALCASWRPPAGPVINTHRGGVTYLTPRQMVHYLTQRSQWSELPRVKGSDVALLRAAREFRDRSAEGRIRAFGISPSSYEHEEIPKTHWMTFGLAELELLRDDEEDDGGSTEIKQGFFDKPGYCALKIVAEDVYATWPAKASVVA